VATPGRRLYQVLSGFTANLETNMKTTMCPLSVMFTLHWF